MKFNLIVLLLGVLSQGSLNAAIYGKDDRLDIHQIPVMRPLASAVAIAVPKIFTAPKGNGNFEMTDVDVLGGGSAVNACSNERFAKQPIIGNCTGFWIGGRYLLTAGHCILPNGIVNNSKHPFCDSFQWYFDFNTDSMGRTHEKNIPANKLYSCTRVIRAENIELGGKPGTNFGNDFAVIELDRPVTGIAAPLKLSKRKVRKGEPVFTIGHPSGLPAKYSGTSSVLTIDNPYYFSVNLDTLGGNSGGPVFNAQREVVGILVSGHAVDYYEDGPCQRVNVCDATGKKCKENSNFDFLQTSNYVQYIDHLLPYLR